MLIHRIALALACGVSSLIASELPLKLEWQTPVGTTGSHTTLQVANSTLFVPTLGPDQPGIHAIDTLTGNHRYTLLSPAPKPHSLAGLALSASKLVFGDTKGTVSAYSWNQTLRWSRQLPEPIEAAPILAAITPDAILDCLITTITGRIYALDGSTGDLLWHVMPTTNQHDLNIPTVTSGGSLLPNPLTHTPTFITHAYCQRLYGLNSKTGAILWKTDLATMSPLSPLYGTKKQLHFVQKNGHFYAIYPSGRLQLHGIHPAITVQTPPVMPTQISARTPFIPLPAHGYTSGFTIQTNQATDQAFPQWTPIGAPLLSAYSNTQKHGMIIACKEGVLLFFSKTGRLTHQFTLPAGAVSTPLIANVDTDPKLELIIALANNTVYCYELPTTGPIQWGQLRANPYNTGIKHATLIEDSSLDVTGSRVLTYPPDTLDLGFRYLPWLSETINPTQISQKGIGYARLGMTYGQFKRRLPSTYHTQGVSLNNGLKAVAVLKQNKAQYYLVFPQQQPLLPHTPIRMILTNNPRYKHASGFHPGMHIHNVIPILGNPIFSYRRHYPLEEKIVFKRQPRYLIFISYSRVKAGTYKQKKTINHTKTFHPGATLQFIGVR